MRMKNTLWLFVGTLLVLVSMSGCKMKTVNQDADLIADNIANAVSQYSLQTDVIEHSGGVLNPRTIDDKGGVVYVPFDDWTSGFFPGSMWYMY